MTEYYIGGSFEREDGNYDNMTYLRVLGTCSVRNVSLTMNQYCRDSTEVLSGKKKNSSFCSDLHEHNNSLKLSTEIREQQIHDQQVELEAVVHPLNSSTRKNTIFTRSYLTVFSVRYVTSVQHDPLRRTSDTYKAHTP